MKKNKSLWSAVAIAVAAVAVTVSSSFAESSPQNRTSGTNITVEGERPARSSSSSREKSDEERAAGRRSSGDLRVEGRVARPGRSERTEPRGSRRDDEPRPPRGVTRERENGHRSAGRDDGRIDRERVDRDRRPSDGRRYEHDRERIATDRSTRDARRSARGWSGQHYTGRKPYYAHGRVSRLSPWRNGYRVWIAGAPYPFYVPHSYYRRHGLRLGLFINLGGYYNDHGYYEYYDDYYDDYYDGSYRDDYYGEGYGHIREIRGYVEDVDRRRDRFVIRDRRTGRYVTVYSTDRRLRVREGDYVEVSGEWRRNGVFRAYDIDIRDRYRRRR